MKNNESGFEEIEKTLAEIRSDAKNFGWKRDTVAASMEIIMDRKQAPFAYRRKLWQSLAILLLICNLTQGFLLVRSRRNPVLTAAPAEMAAAVIPATEPPAAEVKQPTPQKNTDTEVYTAVNKEPGITAEEGLNQLLGLYRLFETLSPEIILPAANNNALPENSQGRA